MSGTLTVACKVPNGLILRGGAMVEVSVPVMGGGSRVEQQWRPNGKAVEIAGPKRSMGEDPASPTADGFALTFGVDADFMTQWLKDNADHDAVVNGLLYCHAQPRELKAMTKDSRDQRTGLEPLSQSGDRRVPKAIAKADKAA